MIVFGTEAGTLKFFAESEVTPANPLIGEAPPKAGAYSVGTYLVHKVGGVANGVAMIIMP